MEPASVGLDRESIRELAGRVIATEGEPAEPFGLYVFPAGAPESELARSVERTVFGEFFGNSPELLAAEYGPYEATTFFVCALDQRRRLPAGMMRLIFPSPSGSKSLADIEAVWGQHLKDVCGRSGLDFDQDGVLDVATLAVDAEYRGDATSGLVSLSMYQAVIQAAIRRDLQWIVTVLDLVVLDLVQNATSTPMQHFAGLEPISYLDSPASIPVYCNVEEYRHRLRTTDESMYGILFEETGLEAAMRPPDWGAVLGDRLRAHGSA